MLGAGEPRGGLRGRDPACTRAHWRFLSCAWVMDSYVFSAAVKGEGEDGRRDASSRRPCWGCKRLTGCKGRG